MNIVYILRASGIAGGQRMVHEHLEGLRARGHDAALCLLSGETDFWLPHTYPIVKPDALAKADIVVATSWPTAWTVDQLRIPGRKAYFVQMRESLFYNLAQVQMASEAEWTYRFDDLSIITISDWLERFLRVEYQRDPIYRVRNGVSPDFNPGVPKLPREKKRVLLVEGTAHQAGKDMFGMVLGVLSELSPDVRKDTEVWGFTHHDIYAEMLAAVADKMFVRPPQEQIPSIYASADVLLKCSRFEGRPCIPVEAMACGCVPVIALGGDGVPTYGVDDVKGDHALASLYGDVDATVYNLETALEDDTLREEMRTAGLAYVRTELSWDRAIDELENALKSIAAGAETSAWEQAQIAEADWWTNYVERELGDPSLPTFIGHRRQQLKEALKRFGWWRDDNLSALPAGTWLDVGSGPVSMLHGLANCHVTAIDPLMAVLAERLPRVAVLGETDNVLYEARGVLDLDEWYQRGQHFDWVFCHNVLDHTPDWREALLAMYHAVAPGGGLWLMTHCRPPERTDRHHVQAFDAAAVLERLVEFGMELEYVYCEEDRMLRLPVLYVRARKHGETDS